MQKELIFGFHAVQMGLVDTRLLVDVGLAWSRGEAPDVRGELIRRGKISDRDAALLDQTVALLLAAHHGDPVASLASLPGAREVLQGLGGVAPDEARGGGGPDEVGGAADDTRRTAPSLALVTPETTSRYTVRGEVGRGGIGRVLAALDEHVGREIAIKELIPPSDANPSGTGDGKTSAASVRFLREARLTGQLEHPSIIPVYEVGRRADGTLYYTMRLVRGRTLGEAIEKAKDLHERLKLLPHFASLCSAIAYAHSRGVLHRDIKPHNVMIGEFSETVVLDWGLAKLKSSAEKDYRFERQMEALKQIAAGKTVAGEAIGTPEYMAPEQAWGELERVDEHSDVYSLGAVLYEMLTGHPPFSGEVAYEVLGKVERYGEGRERLVPVRERTPEVPRELAAIAEKALSARPIDRYPTAMSLLEDVHAYMAGDRVGAYEYTSWELVKRVVAKNRALSAMAALLLVLLLGGAAALAEAYSTARQEQRLAEEKERLVHRHLASGYQEKAQLLVAEQDLLGAQVLAAAGLVESPFNPLGPHYDAALAAALPEEAGAQMASLQSSLYAASRAIAHRHATLVGHDLSVMSVAFSPDGTRLASGSHDRTVRLWSSRDGRALATLAGHGGWVSSVAFTPDGAILASGSADRTVRLWSMHGGQPLAVLEGHRDVVTTVAFSRDGRLLASSGRDRTVRLWETSSRRLVGAFSVDAKRFEGGVETIAFSPDGTRLAVGGPEQALGLWEIPSGRRVAALVGHERAVRSVFFSPDGATLFSLAEDQTVRSWSSEDGAAGGVATVVDARPRIFAMRFRDGLADLVAFGARESTELWDPRTARRLAVLRGHQGLVRALDFSPDGAMLATAGSDKRIQLWRVGWEAGAARLASHPVSIVAMARSRDGRYLVTGARDGEVRLWDATSGASLVTMQGHTDELTAVALSADGRLAASGGRDRTIRLWEIPSGRPVGALEGHSAMVTALAFSAAEPVLASASRDGDVRLWTVPGGAARVVSRHDGGASTVAFSADGKRLASGGRDKVTRVVELATGRVVRSIPTAENVRAIAYSPDGRTVAIADYSWTIRLWDLESGTQRRALAGHADAARMLAFSENGKLLASAGGNDSSVRLWDPEGGHMVQIFRLGEEAVAAVFSQDGEQLLVGDGRDVVVHPLTLDLWRQDPQKLLRRAEDEAGMRLKGFALDAR